MWEFLTFLPDDRDSRVALEPSKEPAAPRDDAQSAEPPAFLKHGAPRARCDEEREDPALAAAETLGYARFLDDAADPQGEGEPSNGAEADRSDGPGD
jgi:hypothetical protein